MDPNKFEDADLEKFKPKWVTKRIVESSCFLDVYGREALCHKFHRLREKIKRKTGGYPFRIVAVRRVLCGPRNWDHTTGDVTRHFWDVAVHVEFVGIE